MGAPCCCCCCCALSLSLDAGRFRSEKEARGGRCVFVVRACSRGREGEKEEAGRETESGSSLDDVCLFAHCVGSRSRASRALLFVLPPTPTPTPRPSLEPAADAASSLLDARPTSPPSTPSPSPTPHSHHHHIIITTAKPILSSRESLSRAQQAKRGQEHPSSLNLLSLPAKATSQIPAQHLPKRSSPTPTPSPPPPASRPQPPARDAMQCSTRTAAATGA